MERDRGNGDGKETLRQRTSKGLMFHGIQRVWCKSAIKLSFHSTSPRTERWPCCWWSVSLRVCHCQYCHCGCQHSTSSLLCYYSLSFIHISRPHTPVCHSTYITMDDAVKPRQYHFFFRSSPPTCPFAGGCQPQYYGATPASNFLFKNNDLKMCDIFLKII